MSSPIIPDFGALRSYKVEQERPDCWSVTVYQDGHEVFASKQLFATEAEARAWASENVR
jgi:hypothetical protein